MQCPNCGHQNGAEARFCSQCGTSLSVSCPVCSTVAEPGAKFCSNCGAALGTTDSSEPSDNDLSSYLPEQLVTKLEAARAGHAMKGERRTVTMLFADIKGSTAAAERLDPEEWADIVNGAFKQLIAPVYRYEGTLAQLQGDAVLAFFGAPIAHEDDPIRAVRAGLEIVEAMGTYSAEVQREWGMPIEVRVGINTGLVVVGEIGSDLRVEYTAVGDAINVAARMEQTAEPGTVRITAETLSLTGGAFESEDLGPVEVKGKSMPIDAHRAIRFVGSHRTGPERPIVGRDEELTALEKSRSRLLGGSGCITALIGEAGVGKSKLLAEFERRSAADLGTATSFDEPGQFFWMSSSGRSYDRTIPFALIAAMLDEWWGRDGSKPDYQRVADSVAASGLEDPDAASFLAHLGGVALPDAARSFIDALETPVLHARAGETLISYLGAVAGQRPLAIVLEDIHWADDVSLGLIDQMMDLTESAPIGLILAMRPYRDDVSWRIHEVAARDHHHRYQALELSPLEMAQAEALIDSLLDETGLSDEMKQRILDRSEGNPMFIEEMALAMIDAGADNADTLVPTSLTGILTARLDRLDDESKYVVQMASVLGSEFERDTLAALVPDTDIERHIIGIMKRDILVEKEGELDTLRFRHPLIQETSYSTILRRTKKELHRRVADFLIDSHPDRVQSIARHMMEADVEAAFPHLIEAGLQSSRAMALADAVSLLTTALENAPDDADPELIERAYVGLGEAHALVPDLTEAAASYQRLYQFGENAERPAACVSALNSLAYATASIGADLDKAGEYLEEARRLAEESGDEIGLAQYHMNSCFVASLSGNLDEAAKHDEATVDLGEKVGVDSIRISGLVRRAINYGGILDFERGEPAIEAALETARENGMEEGIAIINSAAVATLAFARGQTRDALRLAEESQPVLMRYSSFYEASGELSIGWYKFLLGDVEGALTHLAEARRLGERTAQSHMVAYAAAAMALVYATAGVREPIDELREVAKKQLEQPLGELYANSVYTELGFCDLELGDHEAAGQIFSLGLSSSSVTRFVERPRLLCGRALALSRMGQLDEAAALVAEASAYTEEKTYPAFDALIDLTNAEILEARGEVEEAIQALESAVETAREFEQALFMTRAETALAGLCRQTGDDERAESHARSARATIDRIAGTIVEENLRDSFAAHWLEGADTAT